MMVITRSSLDSIPTSYATVSIGFNKKNSLPEKLEAIASAGFNAIELAFPDLLEFAKDHLGIDVTESDYEAISQAGREVRKLCDNLKLQVLVLQPFSNFEGWAKG
jgi:sugar phosphate isomerase/epimerase